MKNHKLKGKAARFGRDWFGYLLHHIGSGPVCIMGFEKTGTPYSSQIYELFKDKHPDVTCSEISVNKGKVSGFSKECVQNRKVVIITENPRDRGSVYAKDIVKKYQSLRERYNIQELTFMTTDPVRIYGVNEILRNISLA